MSKREDYTGGFEADMSIVAKDILGTIGDFLQKRVKHVELETKGDDSLMHFETMAHAVALQILAEDVRKIITRHDGKAYGAAIDRVVEKVRGMSENGISVSFGSGVSEENKAMFKQAFDRANKKGAH